MRERFDACIRISKISSTSQRTVRVQKLHFETFKRTVFHLVDIQFSTFSIYFRDYLKTSSSPHYTYSFEILWKHPVLHISHIVSRLFEDIQFSTFSIQFRDYLKTSIDNNLRIPESLNFVSNWNSYIENFSSKFNHDTWKKVSLQIRYSSINLTRYFSQAMVSVCRVAR